MIFTAVSMAIPMLKDEHLIQFGGAQPAEGKTDRSLRRRYRSWRSAPGTR